MTAARVAKLASLLLAGLSLAGCERMFRDMYDQPKLGPAAHTPLFRDGLASRPPPPGSLPVALGEAAADTSGRHGAERLAALDAADAREALPQPVGAAMLARGRERYTIYCAPCHGSSGAGNGTIVQRGFPAPPSYRIARLRAAPDRQLFDVITHGYGVMYPYGDRVDAPDRWAIVAWVRELQASAPPVASGAAASSVSGASPR